MKKPKPYPYIKNPHIYNYHKHILDKFTLHDEFKCCVYMESEDWICVDSNEEISDEKLESQLNIIGGHWTLLNTANSKIGFDYIYYYTNSELENDALSYMRNENLRLLL